MAGRHYDGRWQVDVALINNRCGGQYDDAMARRREDGQIYMTMAGVASRHDDRSTNMAMAGGHGDV